MINAKDSKNTFYILNKKENTPIVLIHGVGLNHKIWEPQINSFDNTVLVYDILGHVPRYHIPRQLSLIHI